VSAGQRTRTLPPLVLMAFTKPADMPAGPGRTQQPPIGLCRRQGRAAGLGVPESPTFKLRTSY